MTRAKIRGSVDYELWQSLKIEGDSDTNVLNRVLAVIERLTKYDSDPMAAMGALEHTYKNSNQRMAPIDNLETYDSDEAEAYKPNESNDDVTGPDDY